MMAAASDIHQTHIMAITYQPSTIRLMVKRFLLVSALFSFLKTHTTTHQVSLIQYQYTMYKCMTIRLTVKRFLLVAAAPNFHQTNSF